MVVSPYTLRNVSNLFVQEEVVNTSIEIYSLDGGNNHFWTVDGKSYGVIEKEGDTWLAYPSNSNNMKTNVSHVMEDEAALKALLKKCFHSAI